MAKGSDWGGIKTVLEGWAASALVGSVGFDQNATRDAIVLWRHEDAYSTAGYDNYAELNVTSIVQLGRDETRTFDVAGAPAGAERQPTVLGNRIMSLQCSMVSRSQRFDEGPVFLLERARVALKWPSTIDAFDAVGLALVDTGPTFEIPDLHGHRDQARAAMDVRLSFVFSLEDEPHTYIDKVSIGGTADMDFDGVAEVTLPSQEIT